jgi:hypothetical protein
MRALVKSDRHIMYLNSGDWVENLTSLEYQWGKWTIYQYDEFDYLDLPPIFENMEEEDLLEKSTTAALFEQMIHRTL